MEKKCVLKKMKLNEIDSYVDLFIDTFTKEPWYDEYESKQQVKDFIRNHMENNYFVGYSLVQDDQIVGLSIGMKKPWIKGLEYYIDQFLISYDYQKSGLGSQFLKMIEEDIKDEMNAIILNTEKGYPAERFYIKNGFSHIEELIVLAK